MSAAAPLSRYELLERLAVGGMAELYKARRVGAHGFHKPVVIKKILPHLASDRTFVSMFIDEAQISAHLDHPKIVQIVELESVGDELFIAMEYVEGIDALQLMRRCRKAKRLVPPEIAVHIAHEVLDALDYAHSATDENGAPLGIVHRDISPGNVLISKRGNVKLTDFGIAQAAARRHKTESGTLKGKYSYMAPEQVAGAPADPRSDLFSVSIVLSELLIGRRLFAAKADLEILMMVRDAKTGRLDRYGAHIDPELRILLDMGLERRPEDRYQDAARFRDALGDWLYTGGERVRPRDVANFIAELPEIPRKLYEEDEISELIEKPTVSDRGSSPKRYDHIGVKISEGIPEPVERAISEPVGISDGEAPGQDAPPTRAGDFSQQSPLALLWELAIARKTGRLLIEDDGVVKEAYFEHGHPVFVRSNLPSERFGEYLVTKGILVRPQLESALEQMQEHGGRLGATLVALNLLRPLDAVRNLSGQVAEKLIRICPWRSGTYRWYAGERNPWPAVELHLDTYQIIGQGVERFPIPVLDGWMRSLSDRYMKSGLPRIELSRFGQGSKLGYVFNLLDGKHTVAELASRFSAHDRIVFVRLLYLLHVCELATLS